MKDDDLKYNNLAPLLKPLLASGRSESATFLQWFLLNIYRLDDTAAVDCICDKTNDKGIDGIYVDDNNAEIHFFQAKIRQKDNGTIGDVDPKTFSASVKQFDTAAKIDAMLAGDVAPELKLLLQRLEVKDLLASGYRPVGIYVTNEMKDDATNAYAAVDDSVRYFDRSAIAGSFVEATQSEGVTGSFKFDVSYVEPLQMTIQGDQGQTAAVYMFPANALQLVAMSGIADTTLFTKNVRYDLGNTGVNKSIRKSIEDKKEHKNFSLFHNGVIILCRKATLDGKTLTIEDYSVVNGAQSITTFFRTKSKLTGDLRVLVRVIEVTDDVLGRKITEYSNNQNAIKPRDLRSNHALMTRLQNEMAKNTDSYFFEIKRGEATPEGRTVISNEDAGRALLAFDLQEPWSSHQIYKIFDEKYAEIFGRIEVTSSRIVFIMSLDGIVDVALTGIENQPFARYTLTKYFMLYVLSLALESNDKSIKLIRNPQAIAEQGRMDEFLGRCTSILKSIIIDLNYEVKHHKEAVFDYKSILKSPKQSSDLAMELLKSYEKDVARGKATGFDDW